VLKNNDTTAELDRPNTEGRDTKGRFAPGNPGKPKGAKHRFNAEVLERLGGLTSKAFATLERKLDEGELKAATFVLSRFLPSERVIELGGDPNGIADAAAEGELTPTEMNRVAQAVKTIKEASGIDEMRSRLDEIEALLVQRRSG
jgi:hypothetical protein